MAEVVKCEKHPNADKLQVCEVDTGTRALAGGVRRAQCARRPEGRVRAGGRLRARHRPHADQGQDQGRRVRTACCCSERELELSDEHSGIIELDPKAKIGSSAAAALGLDDAVIEVAITPNRPDCLGVRGIARDLAAAGLGKLKKDDGQAGQRRLRQSDPDRARVRQGERRCLPGVRRARWCAGVKNGPSPRLAAAPAEGDRACARSTRWSISPTTSPTTAAGRCTSMTPTSSTAPSARGSGGRASSFVALDGKTYEVDADMCVIADDRAVLGLGGVMGGDETGVTEATTNVFIELAYFDPKRTARTGRKLGISVRRALPVRARRRSRFRRAGARARHRAWCCELCGGEPSKITIAGKPPKPNAPFKFDLGLVKRLSGLDLEQRRHQAACSPRSASRSTARASTSRRRRRPGGPTSPAPPTSSRRWCGSSGVDNVPATPMTRAAGVAKPVLTEAQKRQRLDAARAGRARTGRGGDLVVHCAGSTRNCSAAGRPS